MDRETNLSVDIQDFLAVSARYLGLEAEAPVARSDWVFAPAAKNPGADPSSLRFDRLGERYA